MTPTLDTLLSGSNATYVAELYVRYLENPGSVDPDWSSFFEELQDGGRSILDELRGASWAPSGAAILDAPGGETPNPVTTGVVHSGPSDVDAQIATRDSIRALMMIRTYRVRGHLIARFDPLGLEGNTYHPELDPKYYGFTEDDWDRPIFIDSQLGMETATLREILAVLKATYCGTIGVEFMHIMEPEEKSWIGRRIESIHNRTQFTMRGKKTIYERLIEAEGFERFLDKKWKGSKRFGLDGGEALIAALEQILKRGSQLGVKDVVIGMPHRGRLNVLASVMQKPYQAIFSEFKGIPAFPEDMEGSGDVKYHLGASADRVFDGNRVHLSLVANPSHLEAVNPVVLGKVRSKQTRRRDVQHSKVMGLMMHGDAAFSGQGLVYEALAMSQLKGYQTGGSIHFVVNNQIGFTTVPAKSRSGPYCSDIAKSIQAPIFHVNGDDPEAVVHVARIAMEFRQEFKRDVVVDMYCYRRHGHNEGDEPMFTQPIMYRTIAKHPRTSEIYRDRLIAEGVLTEQSAETMSAEFEARLEADFDAAEAYRPNKADWLEGVWQGLVHLDEEEELREDNTSVPLNTLKSVGRAIATKPDHFNLHPKITRLQDNRLKMAEGEQNVDWAMAEALAFGTLLSEGTAVRLSGQDSGRGTFSHRHAVLIDQVNEEKFYPLSEICDGQGLFEVHDSPLSEAGVLGFEYGFSLDDPHSLTLWEAQFGDFANGAQVIIDQFIASGESKWLRLSGLVLLLPHGMEGQGPEHSSARLERYLQLCAEDNLQVVNITTPANYFHALRRQVRRNYRKPLVVMAPKSLLRHKLVTSSLEDMSEGTRFHRTLLDPDDLVADNKVRRLVLCSGKVYYDLLEARRQANINDVALVRIEQLYPWPRKAITKQIKRYANAELVWCQEETANQGAWSFVLPRLIDLLNKIGASQSFPFYAGRKSKASPATGNFAVHQKQQKAVVEAALSQPATDLEWPFQPLQPDR